MLLAKMANYLETLSHCQTFQELQSQDDVETYVLFHLDEMKRVLIGKHHVCDDLATVHAVLMESMKALYRMISNSDPSSGPGSLSPSLYFMMEVLSSLGDSNHTMQQRLSLQYVSLNGPHMKQLIHDYISDIEQELREISDSCVSFLGDNLGIKEGVPSVKKTSFTKPVSLPPANSKRSARKAASKVIAIKSKAVVSTNLSRKEKLQSVRCSDLLPMIETVTFLSMNIDKLLSILPNEILVASFLESSSNSAGILSSGQQLVSAIRHIYEQILPLLLYLLRESADRSCESTRADLRDYLSISSQRALSSFHKLISIANSRILGSLEAKFQPSSLNTSSSAVVFAMPAGAIKWTEFLSSLLTTNEEYTVSTLGYEVEPWIREAIGLDTGSFISDMCRVYSQTMWEFVFDVCLLEEDSSDRAEYLHSALQAPSGLFVTTTTSTAQHESRIESDNRKSNHTVQPKVSPLDSSTEGTMPPSSEFSDAMALLKSMFPSYGDLFIGACLQVFDGNAERAVDAILTENLPPQLLTVDRSLKTAWVGKGGEDSVAVKVGAQGKAGDDVYRLEEDLNVKAAVKTRILQERQQWEQSLRLIQREYDDDYDDQFDDAIAYKSSAQLKPVIDESVNDNTRASKPQQKQHASRGADTDWSARMAEMKVLNQMTREDEQEVQFWKSMRNTNHDNAIAASSRGWMNSDEESEQLSGPRPSAATNGSTSSQQQKQRPPNSSKPVRTGAEPKPTGVNGKKTGSHPAPSAPEASAGKPVEGTKPHHRPKTYDKHHQKERASRKNMSSEL